MPPQPDNTHLDARIDWRNAANATQWLAAAVDTIADALRRDLAAHDRALLLLSGGGTPGPVHRALAGADLDWARVDVSLADDRWVPGDDPASNAHLAYETLLHGRASKARFWPLVPAIDPATDTDSAVAAAVDAANTRWRERGWVPAIAVLGMGDDGHTASLFPNARGLEHALATPLPYAAIDAHGCPGAGKLPLRITLTAAGLAAARQRLLLLRGDSKRDVLARAAAPGAVAQYPVRAAFADTLDVLWCA